MIVDPEQNKCITSDEFGQGLWLFCKKFSKTFYEEFKRKIVQAGFQLTQLTQEQEIELSIEITISSMWIISKALAPDKKALDILHKIYILGHRNMAESENEKQEMARFAQQELNKRYKTYYENWNDKSGDQTLLAVEMLQYMLNHGQPNRKLFNIILTSSVNMHILGMMLAVLEFRKDFKLTD
jgi:hypothetical protein